MSFPQKRRKHDDEPGPITHNGVATATMELNRFSKDSCYSLTGFHWAYRGNGNSRPGGNAYLEVECFDLFGRSLSKERFQGGLRWSNEFEIDDRSAIMLSN